MEWTSQHDTMFCREVIAFEIFSNKPGSKERGHCLDRIAESLIAIIDPFFKVDQRALRDTIKKLLKSHVEKKTGRKRLQELMSNTQRLMISYWIFINSIRKLKMKQPWHLRIRLKNKIVKGKLQKKCTLLLWND